MTYGGSHVDLVASLVPAIKNHPNLEHQILALTIASKKLNSLKINFKQCKDFLPLDGYEEALKIGRSLSKPLWDKSTGIPFEESAAYLGVSMVDLIKDLGEKKAWEEYEGKGRKAFLPCNFLQQILSIEKPDIVVTTCDVRMERAAHLSALKMRMLSIRIEDLLGFSVLGEHPVNNVDYVIPREEWPDRVIVPNDFTRNRMLKAGMEKWRVVALGQPFLSQWLEESHSSENISNRKNFINENKLRITYIMPGRKDVLIDQGKAVTELARKRKDWKFLFKLHPGVPKKEFLTYVPSLPDNILLVYEGDLRDIINQSSILITFKSTVGFLGYLSGVPLIILNCTGESNILPYVSEGIATPVYSYGNLESEIEKNLKIKETVSVQSKVLEVTTGASQRIANYLADL